MEDRRIKLAALALLTPVKEVLGDVIVPQSLSDLDGDDKAIIQQADELLKSGRPSVKGRDCLGSIFNVLNGNDGKMYYRASRLDDRKNVINYPVPQAETDQTGFRRNAAERINSVLGEMVLSDIWLNRFFELLETETTYLPGTLEDPDISLFDQAKLCAAFAMCLMDAQGESGEEFLLYSMDFSGIQDFIYTIQSKGALKTLRARSFYLEILMENAIDDILEELGLSRINVLYSGGGHCYMLLPNNAHIVEALEDYNSRLNDWLIDTFDISLFVGHGYASCNADALRNIPKGSYSELFRSVSRMISSQKANRYSASQLLRMNNRTADDYTRECKVCHRLDKLNKDNECSICSSIKNFSNDILSDSFFAVCDDPAGVLLPNSKYLKGFNKVPEGSGYKRLYRKKSVDNNSSLGLRIGDYTSYETFEEMASDAKKKGCIERIGVIRADVDNLGTAISIGFDKTVGGNIMRTSALSRQLSLFFKSHINYILAHPKFDLGKTPLDKGRNASVCYSGGDDLFVVGEWDDIIGFAVDITKAFARFTQGTLSVSAGIGIYDSKYPISRIAYETAELEDKSKKLPGKRAVTLLEDGAAHSVTDNEGHVFSISDGTYTWTDFETEVIGEKYLEVSDFFSNSDTRGLSFMYNLLELVRKQSEKINFARFVYVLSRLEPGENAEDEEKARYKSFAVKLTGWIKSEKDLTQLKTAMTLYAYMIRNKEEQ